jgi:hypothetical protein
MEMLILKTNINSKIDFKKVKYSLVNYYNINECTVDLGDRDKVLRVVGNELDIDDVISTVKELGYYCEDLDY